MKKSIRFFGMIMVIIATVVFLYGCSMLQRNNDRYREQRALKVGNEEITLERIINFFDSSMTTYINYGYDVQTVWNSLFPQFISQYVAIDAYKEAYTGTVYSGELNNRYANGKYLESSDIAYFEKESQLSLLDSLEASVETMLEGLGFTFTDEDTDTSERAELTEIKLDNKNLTGYNRAEGFDPTEQDEELAKYKAQTTIYHVDYVYTDMQDERLLAMVESYNDRLDEDADKLSVEQYVDIQLVTYDNFVRQIVNNGYDSLSDYLVSSVESYISQQLYNDYANEIYSKFESNEIDKALQSKLDNLTKQAKEGYDINPTSFETFVTGLSATSFVYSVPEQYNGKFGFVKNLLLPFSEEQTEELTAVGTVYGKTSKAYFEKRAELATRILVTDFIDAPDAEDADKANAGFVIGGDGTQVVDSTFFGSMVNGVDADTFIDLMFRYNTDTAQHNSAYDYVIAKDAPDITGTADKWVVEFAKESRRLANDGTVGGIGYALTDYGVHVIYYAGDVVADSFDWSTKLNNQKGAGTAAYRFYKTYYDAIVSDMLTKDVDALVKGYKADNKIEYNESVLQEYLDQYSIVLFPEE